MRNILFRGKREDNNEWIIGSDAYTVDGSVIRLRDDNNNAVNVNPHTIGLYTGKDDCNNNPAYEGDIVKSRTLDIIAVVRYSEDYACFELEDEDENFYNFVADEDVWEEFDIIGNIHDTPELLTGENIRR